MSSVGETLRRERLRKDRSLEQISHETKISTRLLEAIEHDQFDQLPGGVFAKSFVRQYARVLSLDEDELAAEVQKAIQDETALPGFTAPPEPAYKVPKLMQWESTGTSSKSSALPALALVVAVMLVCSGIYAWWQRSRRPAPPSAPRAAVQATAGTAASRSEPAPVTPAVAHDAGESSTPPETAASTTAPVNPAATLHVSMTATEDNWVRAWADGKDVMTRVLRPGLIKTIDAVDEIRIRTGNAGSLEITLNGKPLGPVGPKGQIRIIQVTRNGVQILPPPKPAPDPL